MPSADFFIFLSSGTFIVAADAIAWVALPKDFQSLVAMLL
jgi:hypothetical protein